MTEKQYYDKFDHTERECEHEWDNVVYCDCLGLKVDEEDLVENECCPICFGNGDNLFHECEYCGERITHNKYLELLKEK